MKKVLVTGGCGFIGANLVPMLRAKDYAVSIFDNLSRGSRDFLDDETAYTITEADIRDEAALKQVAANHDVIVHLAAYGSVVESVESPEENFDINVRGTFNVLNAARLNGIKRVVFSSTGGALIGNAKPPVNESSLPRPISPYGASKLACEAYCCAFANAYDMSVTALRFANVIGPISWHKKGAVTAFFKSIMAKEDIRIYGDGSATRDFLYVEDLCRGIIAGVEAAKPGFNAFHLASGREVSVKELAEVARMTAGSPDHPIVFEPKRKGEVERNFATFDRAKAELDFEPVYSLEEGMKRCWEWFKSQQQC